MTVERLPQALRPPAVDRPGLSAPAVGAGTEPEGGRRPDWSRSYIRRLEVSDVASVVCSIATAQLVRFGAAPPVLYHARSMLSYTLVSAVLTLAWLVALGLFRTREPRVVGTGVDEYRRVAHASLAMFGTVAIVAFLLQLEVARGYLAVALPLGLATLLGSRVAWRQWLVRQRNHGHSTSTVLVVGSHRTAVSMADLFERDPAVGYRVVGVCVPGWATAHGQLQVHGHPVRILGDEHAVLEALRTTGADMVAVSNTESLGAQGMRALAWELEAVDVDLVVSSGVLDVAGPRLQIRPVAGLPLLHVDKPQYRGASRIGKMVVDLLGAVLGLVALAPVLVLAALAVKLTSPGPVLYRSERIGLNGTPFGMLKFRSMVVDAESLLVDLSLHNEGAGPLFKVRHDPRVTRVGYWLRRMSIDELPQLVNVLRGEMSVVGPRPPLRSEVDTYTDDVHRRLLVKPGLTGLWQVSGRSNLSWEESVRLDLYYVENWSMVQDLSIVWRTLGAVIHSRGAY